MCDLKALAMEYSSFLEKKKKATNLSSVISKGKQTSESQMSPSWDDEFLNAEFLLFSKEETDESVFTK